MQITLLAEGLTPDVCESTACAGCNNLPHCRKEAVVPPEQVKATRERVLSELAIVMLDVCDNSQNSIDD